MRRFGYRQPNPRHQHRLQHKPRLNEAFRLLRKNGFIARQGFMCCMGCACVALDALAKKRAEAGKPAKGIVYYHRQDAEYFEGGYKGTLMIRFMSPSDMDADTAKVAQETIEIFTAAGVPTTWDQEIDHCIEVDLDVITEESSTVSAV